MKNDKTENIEIYFICNQKKKMDLIESYYDEELDIHYWYFNAYLAYKAWQENFKDIKGELAKMLLTVAASKYLIYKMENSLYKSPKELEQIKKDMQNIKPKLEKIHQENDIFLNL